MLKSCICFYVQLASLLIAVCNPSRPVEFSIVRGQRLSSRVTENGRLTTSAMTGTACAIFCSNVCGVFHFSTVTNECTTFVERNYATGFVLISDPDWTVCYRTNHATVKQGDWTLVFRAQSGVGEPTWESWNNTGVYNDNPVPQDFPLACLRLTNYSTCDRHFRSRILDNWPSIKEVRVSYTKADSEVAYILFNGTGTDRDSWFSKNRILNSTWSPALENEPKLSDTGVYGHVLAHDVRRRFYLHGPHDGCRHDWFYTLVSDLPGDRCATYGYWHVTLGGVPNIFYSPSPFGRASFRDDQAYPFAERADVLSVWVKFA